MVARLTASGMRAASVVTTRGHSRLFHANRTVMIVSALSEGLVSGSITRQNICHGEAPSRRAASSISDGSPRKACRIKNVPKALNTPGAAIPHTVFIRPRFCTISNCGIKNAWVGTIRIDRITAKMIPRPQKCMRANAKPAIEQKAICPATVMMVTTTEMPRSEERRVGKEGRSTRWPRDWSSDVCSSDLRVHQAKILHDLELRDQKCLGGHHQDRQDHREDDPAAPEVHARERETSHRAEGDLPGHCDDGDHHGDAELTQERHPFEHRRVVLPSEGLRPQAGRHTGDLRLRRQADDDLPQEREGHHEAAQDQGGMHEYMWMPLEEAELHPTGLLASGSAAQSRLLGCGPLRHSSPTCSAVGTAPE